MKKVTEALDYLFDEKRSVKVAYTIGAMAAAVAFLLASGSKKPDQEAPSIVTPIVRKMDHTVQLNPPQIPEDNK